MRHGTYPVRVPASGVPYVPRTVASQAANEGASCKIIGLTLETRPDCIDAEELRRLRRYGRLTLDPTLNPSQPQR